MPLGAITLKTSIAPNHIPKWVGMPHDFDDRKICRLVASTARSRRICDAKIPPNWSRGCIWSRATAVICRFHPLIPIINIDFDASQPATVTLTRSRLVSSRTRSATQKGRSIAY